LAESIWCLPLQEDSRASVAFGLVSVVFGLVSVVFGLASVVFGFASVVFGLASVVLNPACVVFVLEDSELFFQVIYFFT